MRIYKFIISAVISLALTACAAQQPQTLDEQLSGKSPEEKKEIIRLACLKEAMQVGNGPHQHIPTLPGKQSYDNTVQTDHFKHICREMNENYPSETQQ